MRRSSASLRPWTPLAATLVLQMTALLAAKKVLSAVLLNHRAFADYHVVLRDYRFHHRQGQDAAASRGNHIEDAVSGSSGVKAPLLVPEEVAPLSFHDRDADITVASSRRQCSMPPPEQHRSIDDFSDKCVTALASAESYQDRIAAGMAQADRLAARFPPLDQTTSSPFQRLFYRQNNCVECCGARTSPRAPHINDLRLHRHPLMPWPAHQVADWCIDLLLAMAFGFGRAFADAASRPQARHSLPPEAKTSVTVNAGLLSYMKPRRVPDGPPYAVQAAMFADAFFVEGGACIKASHVPNPMDPRRNQRRDNG